MENFFGADGLLADMFSGFEPRQGQLIMARAVHELLQERKEEYSAETNILLVEAETGIGKTLAYLIPAIISGKKIVISTATINLQDQILKKEIPLIETILGDETRAICIKGRQNYLCHYRWFQLRSSPQLSLIEDDSVDRIDEWLQETATGDRSELDWLPDNSPLWPQISAQSHQCLGSECPEISFCFIHELRRRAGSARLLIVNHHLFFSDLALRREGYGEVLPRYEGVIFDEAHHLENTASSFFGKSFSQYQIYDLVTDLERQAAADLSPSLADRIIGTVRGLKERTENFSRIFPPERGRFPLLQLIEEHSSWYDEVKHLSTALQRIVAEMEQFRDYGEGWKLLIKRVDDLHTNLIEIALPDVIMEEGRHIHWYEKRERAVSLSATPIDVSQNLREILYPGVDFCVMTSATLTTGGDFSYMCQRLGIDESVHKLRLQSPFDYKGRTCLYIPGQDFPLPSSPLYGIKLRERVCELLVLTQGRALVLCTSFRGMDSLAEYLEERLPYPVLVQGRASRHALLQEFMHSTASVLVAVASFWEGVDVPGESLSCVVIDKLPFEVPSDPVLQARVAAIRDSGGNPFYDFQVPRAILTLRQGIGRLMRTGSDRGVIAIMDGRLYAKAYGRRFLRSMPPSPVVRELAEVATFFQET